MTEIEEQIQGLQDLGEPPEHIAGMTAVKGLLLAKKYRWSGRQIVELLEGHVPRGSPHFDEFAFRICSFAGLALDILVTEYEGILTQACGEVSKLRAPHQQMLKGLDQAWTGHTKLSSAVQAIAAVDPGFHKYVTWVDELKGALELVDLVRAQMETEFCILVGSLQPRYEGKRLKTSKESHKALQDNRIVRSLLGVITSLDAHFQTAYFRPKHAHFSALKGMGTEGIDLNQGLEAAFESLKAEARGHTVSTPMQAPKKACEFVAAVVNILTTEVVGTAPSATAKMTRTKVRDASTAKS